MKGTLRPDSLISFILSKADNDSKIHCLFFQNTASTPFIPDTFDYNLDERKSQNIDTSKTFLVLVWIIERL